MKDGVSERERERVAARERLMEHLIAETSAPLEIKYGSNHRIVMAADESGKTSEKRSGGGICARKTAMSAPSPLCRVQ